jgi:hypothetical protein
VGLRRGGVDDEPAAAGVRKPAKSRNISPYHALLSTNRAARHPKHMRIEGAMATKQHGQIVETPTEARQAEPGPSVFALLTISTGLAILILGVIWFAFFRT